MPHKRTDPAEIRLRHTGDSSNLAFYGEAGPERAGRVWCDVLQSPRLRRINGELRRDPAMPHRHFLRIYRAGEGVIREQIIYDAPRKVSRLSDRTVTRLVREALTS